MLLSRIPLSVLPHNWSSGLRVRAETSISCQLVSCSPFSHTRRSSLCEESTGLVRRNDCIALLAAFFARRGHQVHCASRENTTIVAMATFVQELLPRAPDEAWPTSIRLLSHTQARTSESTNLHGRDTDKNHQIWHAKLVLATTGLHLAQFRQPRRPLAKAGVDYADLFIYDEAQQEAALSDLATLGALPRKCLVLRLGDPKQSGGTGPSDLARRVRLVSNQVALGIRAPRKPCLPQAIPALIQSQLQDDLPQARCPAPQDVPMAENAREATLMESHPQVENHQLMLSCLLNLRACHWHLHCSRSQEVCPSGAHRFVLPDSGFGAQVQLRGVAEQQTGPVSQE